MVEFSVMAVTLAKKLVYPLKETHHQTIYFLRLCSWVKAPSRHPFEAFISALFRAFPFGWCSSSPADPSRGAAHDPAWVAIDRCVCSGRRGDDQATRRLHGLDLHRPTRIDPVPQIFRTRLFSPDRC